MNTSHSSQSPTPFYETSAGGQSGPPIDYKKRSEIFGMTGTVIALIGLLDWDIIISFGAVLGYIGLRYAAQAEYMGQEFIRGKYLSIAPFLAVLGYFLVLTVFAATEAPGAQRFTLFVFLFMLSPGYILGAIFSFLFKKYMAKKDALRNPAPEPNGKMFTTLQVGGIIAFCASIVCLVPFWIILALAASYSGT